ncbi:hypothetical protein PHLGIDRAFT_26058 [Phlebiopsis gigantea 11061_1 CR5-6]|uniref:NADP-dependent oxidoreductase domain-containing protein n=1 Tax=Phlebiopsis gigantea (strain 11061_1 CR5-6) TaxID=745531 RepID=A0A0C3RSV7_PHLG1|nr:hypothetical protein PHLGIDRAFT_26058 [Phlebiopsis gigantea 11061_1 CR5-6]
MASALTLQSSRRLFSGNTTPLLGFGVAYGFGKEEEFAVLTKPSLANELNVGYRHVDTAQMYKNEKHVGEGIREAVYLGAGSLAADNRKLRLEQWRALVDSKRAGKVRDIGEIKDVGLELPAVNQVELHPFLVEAYCAVVRGAMDHPVIADIAKKHNKDNAQVLLRWSLQTGQVCTYPAFNSGPIRSNADLYNFEIDADDMQQLETVDKGAEGACSWNPVNID